MRITRRFTQPGQDVYSAIEWAKRSSKISNLDGSVVFEMNDAEVPSSWSQLATDIMVSKYFRKAGVPQLDESGNVQKDEQGNVITGPERSARQVIDRLADCWRRWGEQHGYFDTAGDAQAFYDELAYMLINQMCAPNSPQWFNTGLYSSYGINGPAQGHYYTDPKTGQTVQSEDAYSHPQPHACFIQSIEDDLVNPGGIMDLWIREARLFKYGSGTGTNFSNIRGEGEALSGGGKSSGLMSFLRIGDRAAGAIKSGGTTRRAAKMVCLDVSHPDIEEFVTWKVREELKVAAMAAGMKHMSKPQREAAEELGLTLDYDFNGEAYATVSGQNSNNSVRLSHEFFEAVDADDDWVLKNRNSDTIAKTVKARDLWDKIGKAAWQCADPGLQYDGSINDWHTCPESGRINASNPCSEYMFLDNTACNLASLNLLTFYNNYDHTFDVDGFEHAIRLWTIVLEISVLMAQYPSEDIARLSYEYRTLGLGYANLGAMLMQAGIPYDSERGRALCGCITSVLTGVSYATSAEMAGELGPFPGYHKNKKHMLRVIRNHRRAAYGVSRDASEAAQHQLRDYEDIKISPVSINPDLLDAQEGDIIGTLGNSDALYHHAKRAWDDALALGEQFGYRNAQTTVIAPTGTIGLLMDCDTTGVEPDFALVKFKKLSGGGYFKIANQSLRPSLQSLGYDDDEIINIMKYVMGTLNLDVPIPEDDQQRMLSEFLIEHGLIKDDIDKAIDALPTIFELPHALNAWTLGEDAIERLGLTDQATSPTFNLLESLGLTDKQIKQLNKIVCGTQMIEGAPGLKEEHLPVFDCANTCGPDGKRYILAEGHIRMMAAAQPFISGAISKTINLPNSASVENIKESYRLSWELGLKANALYRDGCKLSQVLNNKVDADDEVEDEEAIEAAQEEVAAEVASIATTNEPVEKIVERIVERPLRRRLPDTRASKTHKFNVAGHEGYLTVGLYEDGNPGELFITMAKEGSTIGGLMDSLGTAISVALQYGVPIESLVNKFTHQRFEPAGMTHNRDIPFAKSLVDYIFRWLGMEFIPGYRAANAPKRPNEDKKKEAKASEAKAKSLASSDRIKVSTTNGDSLVTDPAKRITTTAEPVTAAVTPKAETNADGTQNSALAAAMREMQADAPACDVCGTITVRNGTCYKCMNCGASMGCS
ncbi:Vitamin B12-dependent ribonucleotide reductase [Poriferisphaera corsica]|uniref:Vitamin B12-dependent ribonucleotide reductase n=1 Tax=Poriferisphaera corsica TaxID=2528020 RepID=A0A517YUI4_9BACT|nr:adenosylcobalamin-dependent ribonucleoside-diphosphate reductase [Poriferisphaera corsica]QDU33867.1 Vitamin B12-dependent ribonucleotide reductase [Poriferisphaera corsica]